MPPLSLTPPQEAPERYRSLSGHRMSASPASIGGTSSSLRSAQEMGVQSLGSAVTISGASSQLSYTKRVISASIAANQPSISGLSAMNIGSPPSNVPASASSSAPSASAATASPNMTQPSTMSGITAIPISSSPSPSLIKRYSSSRYSRSYGQGSSGSSPGDAQTFWGPESLGRRSRLSSGHSREDMVESTSAAPASRQRVTGSAGTPVDQVDSSAEIDDIKSFLGMIDSRAQISQGDPSTSRLLGTGGSGSRSAVFGRAQAEERLRNLADSVYRDPAMGTSTSPSLASSRPIPVAQRVRNRSGEPSPSYLPSRPSYSPDLSSASPVDAPGYLSSSGGTSSVRIRASQPPMSNSIPEEEGHHGLQTHSSHSSRAASPIHVAGTHFSFPRYVSTSMRRRGSSHSSGSGPLRPSILGPQLSSSQTLSSSAATTPQGEDSPGQSPTAPPYETSEEQTIGQLDLSMEGNPVEQERSNEQYRWKG